MDINISGNRVTLYYKELNITVYIEEYDSALSIHSDTTKETFTKWLHKNE